MSNSSQKVDRVNARLDELSSAALRAAIADRKTTPSEALRQLLIEEGERITAKAETAQ
jgi:hypothetical protein